MNGQEKEFTDEEVETKTQHAEEREQQADRAALAMHLYNRDKKLPTRENQFGFVLQKELQEGEAGDLALKGHIIHQIQQSEAFRGYKAGVDRRIQAKKAAEHIADADMGLLREGMLLSDPEWVELSKSILDFLNDTDITLFDDTSDEYIIRNYSALKKLGEKAAIMLNYTLPTMAAMEQAYGAREGYLHSEEGFKKFFAANNLAVSIHKYMEYINLRMEIINHPLYKVLYEELDGQINEGTLNRLERRIAQAETDGKFDERMNGVAGFVRLVALSIKGLPGFEKPVRDKTMEKRLEDSHTDFKFKKGKGEEDLPDHLLSQDDIEANELIFGENESEWRAQKPLDAAETKTALEIVKGEKYDEIATMYSLLGEAERNMDVKTFKIIMGGLTQRKDINERANILDEAAIEAKASTLLANYEALEAYNQEHQDKKVEGELYGFLYKELSRYKTPEEKKAAIEKFNSDHQEVRGKEFKKVLNDFLNYAKNPVKFKYVDDNKLITDYNYVMEAAEKAADIGNTLAVAKAAGLFISYDRERNIKAMAAAITEHAAYISMRFRLVKDPHYVQFFFESNVASIEGEGEDEDAKALDKAEKEVEIRGRISTAVRDGAITEDVAKYLNLTEQIREIDSELYTKSFMPRVIEKGFAYPPGDKYLDDDPAYELGLKMRRGLDEAEGPENLQDDEVKAEHAELGVKTRRWLEIAKSVLTGNDATVSDEEVKRINKGVEARQALSAKARTILERGVPEGETIIRGQTTYAVRQDILSHDFAEILDDISDETLVNNFSFIAFRVKYGDAIRAFIRESETEDFKFHDKEKKSMLAIADMLSSFGHFVEKKLAVIASPYYPFLFDEKNMQGDFDYDAAAELFSSKFRDDDDPGVKEFVEKLLNLKINEFLTKYDKANTRVNFGYEEITDEDIPKAERLEAQYAEAKANEVLNLQEEAESLKYLMTGQQDIDVGDMRSLMRSVYQRTLRKRRASMETEGFAAEQMQRETRKRNDAALEEAEDAKAKRKREEKLEKLLRRRALKQTELQGLLEFREEEEEEEEANGEQNAEAGARPHELNEQQIVAKLKLEKEIADIDKEIEAERAVVAAAEQAYTAEKNKAKAPKLLGIIMSFLKDDTRLFDDTSMEFIVTHYKDIMEKCEAALTIKNEVLPKAISIGAEVGEDAIVNARIKCEAMEKYYLYAKSIVAIAKDPLGAYIYDEKNQFISPQIDRVRRRYEELVAEESAKADAARQKIAEINAAFEKARVNVFGVPVVPEKLAELQKKRDTAHAIETAKEKKAMEMVALGAKVLAVEEQGTFIRTGESMAERLKASGFVVREKYLNEYSDDPEVRKKLQFMVSLHRELSGGTQMTDQQIEAQQSQDAVKRRTELSEKAKKLVDDDAMSKAIEKAKGELGQVVKLKDFANIRDDYFEKLMDDDYVIEHFEEFAPQLALGTALYGALMEGTIPGAPTGNALRNLKQKALDFDKASGFISTKLKLMAHPLYKEIYDETVMKEFLSQKDMEKNRADTGGDEGLTEFRGLVESLKSSEFLASFAGKGRMIEEEEDEALGDKGPQEFANIDLTRNATDVDPAFDEIKIILNGLMKDRELAEHPPAIVDPNDRHSKALLTKDMHNEIRLILDQLRVCLSYNDGVIPENNDKLVKQGAYLTILYERVTDMIGEFVATHRTGGLTKFNIRNSVNNDALLVVFRRLMVLTDYISRQTYNSAKVTSVYFEKYGRKKDVSELWTQIFYYSKQNIDFSAVVKKEGEEGKPNKPVEGPENDGAFLVKNVDNIFIVNDHPEILPSAIDKADIDSVPAIKEYQGKRNDLKAAIATVIRDRDSNVPDDNPGVDTLFDRIRTGYSNLFGKIKEYIALAEKMPGEKSVAELTEVLRLQNFRTFIFEEWKLIHKYETADGAADDFTEVRNKHPNQKGKMFEIIELWRERDKATNAANQQHQGAGAQPGDDGNHGQA